MPRIWLGNLDFERTLSGENSSSELDRFCAEWAFAFLPIAEAGDVIVVPEDFDRGFVHALQQELSLPDVAFSLPLETPQWERGFELMPWGWSPAVQAWGHKLGLQTNSPPLDVVRRVHARDYSFRIAEELSVQLADARRVGSIEELLAVVRRQPAEQAWVIKSRWGASGRGQLRRRGNSLSEQDQSWAASLLRRDGVLFWEPWLNAIGEAGVQFEIPVADPPRLIAIVPMLTDRRGQYIGSVVPVANDAELAHQWRAAVEIGLQVCQHLQSEGYHGPVGIDSMRYVDEAGVERIRPIQEINARWTMGRLAAAWRRYLPPSAKAKWVQASSPVASHQIIHRLATSPDSLGGQATKSRMELRWE